MKDVRPSPDALLARIKAEASESKRGSLRIFFGYAAGVGKTYSMLESAHEAVRQGREVVVGYIEPHARPETQALLDGLEVLPLREISYRGVTLKEFDVDAALARHPEILLVDELAHTNAVGSRHEKRSQDIEELVHAGINVWTTLNVQHIESLNDVIGQVTGIIVRETIPDRIFDAADELELVDVTPEELLHRLNAGKIYLPEQAQRAIQKFFQKGNLTALRELSLRQAARHVHDDVRTARKQQAAKQPWATSDRLLVCVGPSPTTTRVIRTAKRMAVALDASWTAVSVDLTGAPTSSRGKQQISQHFRLAEQLGAETLTLAGQDVTSTILDYARSQNVTKIFIGKTNQPRWKRLLFGTVVDDLLDKSDEIDVYVIHGKEDEKSVRFIEAVVPAHLRKGPYLFAACWVAVAVMVEIALRHLRIANSESNTAMLFLAAVAWTAFRHGRGPSILASVLSVLVFDFFFIPPYLTFGVADVQYLVTFAVMLAIGLVISTLTSRLKAQVESTRLRERRTTALYELGKQLSSTYGQFFLVAAAATKIQDLCQGEVAVYLASPDGHCEIAYGQGSQIARHPVSTPAAIWVIEHDQLAGTATNTLPNAAALFIPIIASQRTLGAIAVRVDEPQRLLDPDSRRMLEACAYQLALSLERDQLALDAADARIQAETEQVRSSLLSSVSHDLKTPLAAIAGASSALLEGESMDLATRRQLLETVADEAIRLNRLLENILQMSKLDAGAAAPNKQWHVLEEIVGSALHRVRREVGQHEITVTIPEDLPLVFVDGLLMEQAFINLLENAARYTPRKSRIAISASLESQSIRIVFSDDGPGIPSGSEERIFEKFYRATSNDAGRGSGLGLAICRAIVKAHGGAITAANRPSGGAEFVIRLPMVRDTPRILVD
ncbi:MAG: two-component sensor histidine kinase [Planctomycetes bacterium SCN 63-9]|nr:MAG: two-component sensor histidine kinase [Planctomycetes bacterium SCN 63-9]